MEYNSKEYRESKKAFNSLPKKEQKEVRDQVQEIHKFFNDRMALLLPVMFQNGGSLSDKYALGSIYGIIQ